MNKILFISSEAYPLIKTGGLADVAGSLPVELLKMKQDIRLMIPAYRGVVDKLKHHKIVAETSYYDLPVKIIESKLPGSHVNLWLVDCPALFDRPGGPYSNEHGDTWDDNALRFAVFCHSATSLAMDELALNWKADIVHCNDWQTGLVPALLSLRKKPPATIFTIHNLAYQGVFSAETFTDLHLPAELWHFDGVEFYNQLSFIKGGLAYADKITTVSPSYASEIRTAEHGYGLEGLLNHRQQDLSGILNGIEHKVWNPGTDEYLTQKYNSRSLEKKAINKTALQEEYSLTVDERIPMIGMVSRLVEQKGLEIILQSLETLHKHKLQIFILGTGNTHYEIQLCEWAHKYPQQIKVVIGYDEALAHRIEAASDIYMMPSKFEPCGLNQLYSLRYATIPVVTRVGGLADTVIDASHADIDLASIKTSKANGFIIEEHTAESFSKAIVHAIELYDDHNKWHQLQLNAMKCNHSWQMSAHNYIQLYDGLLV